jgi:hypothetical protein
MTIRDAAIAKLQEISEPLLQEVNDFIDFVVHKHQAEMTDSQLDELLAEKWSRWFKAVDELEVTPSEPESTYPELLLSKYRQQGLEL